MLNPYEYGYFGDDIAELNDKIRRGNLLTFTPAVVARLRTHE